jgi:hypothetical protein
MGIGLVVLACLRFGEISALIRGQSAGTAPAIDTRFTPSPAAGEPDAVTITSPTATPAVEGDQKVFPGVKAELLAQVRDDTPWVRSDEADAWFHLWSVVAKTSPGELAAASVGRPGFVELFQQPRAFRGQVVSVRGTARQATYVEAAENDAGIKGYYRVVMWHERGPAEPIFVYALELPAGFPKGDDIRAEIDATGLFFKRMVYPSQREGELRRAPAIVAQTLTWLSQTSETAVADNSMFRVVLALTVLGIVGLVLAAAWAGRARATTRPSSAATIDPIDDRTVVDVNQSLRDLAENDR